jgi:hypothetical protein
LLGSATAGGVAADMDEVLDDTALEAAGHDHVLVAMRQLLADGRAMSVEDLCKAGIDAGLLPAGTVPKYVYQAIAGAINRSLLRGERPEFVELSDGRFRLNVRADMFTGHRDPVRPNPELDSFIGRLRASSRREIKADPDDGTNLGAPFERDVTRAFEMLGLMAERRGGEGEPDVVVTAPLGSSSFVVSVECKTASHDSEDADVKVSFASQAARLRDQIGADYAVLLGPGFPGTKILDGELATHRVALWTVEDLEGLLRAAAVHPIAWPAWVPLLAPGRRAKDITEFCYDHEHGAYVRAHVTLRYVLEEGLAYQIALRSPDPQVERVDAPLTVEVLATLVNQRLARENDLARIGVEDVRSALTFASHPLVDAARVAKDGSVVVVRRAAADAGGWVV